MIGRSGTGIALNDCPHPQSGHDPRHIRYQTLRQVAHLGARIGDDLLALAIIEVLATSSVLLAGQPKREPHSFCSDGKSCNLGGPCRLSSTSTMSAPSKFPAASAICCAISRRTIRFCGACRIGTCASATFVVATTPRY